MERHAQYINTWIKQFDEAIQGSANEILKVLQSSGATEAQLQEAAVRYGIPLLKVTKVNLRSLPPWLVDSHCSAAEDPLTPYFTIYAHYTKP